MSEPDNQPPPKAPTVKTSAVPLKKETVRITLRPSAPPSEPLPAAAPPPPTAQVPATPPRPTAPPAPSGAAPPPPRPPAGVGAPTIPLRSAPPPPAARIAPPTVPVGGAPPPPTRPIGGAPPPPAAVGSKTIPLQGPPGARPVAPARPTGTVPGGAPATQALPKATVKLQKTQSLPSGPPTASVSSAPIKHAQLVDDDEEEMDEGPLNIMGVVSLVGGIAAVLIACMSLQKIPAFANEPPATTQEQDSWRTGAYPEEESAMKLAPDYNPFHTFDAETDKWTNGFEARKDLEVSIPQLVEN